MADWGLVAAIVALLAYPLQVYAIPRFLKFIDQACGRFYRWIWPSGQQCTTLEWSDFSDGPYHGTKAEPMQSCCELSSNDPEKSTQLLFSGCWGKALSLLFPDPWRRAVDNQKVPKPYQLSSTTQYIRTDPAVLLLYTYFSTLCYDGASEFDDFVQLNESNGVLVARMCLAQRKRPSQGSYDAVCQRLCSSTGAQMRVILFEDAYIPGDNGKLIGGEDYWRGGGWVVAVGLSTKETIKGSALLRPILRADLVESSFRYKEDSQYMMLPRYVDTALEHVVSTLERLDRKVGNNEHLKHALEMIREFRGNLTRYLSYDKTLLLVMRSSHLFRGVLFNDLWKIRQEIGKSEADYEYAIGFFNKYEDIKKSDQERLGPILKDICRAALLGMIRVFQFYQHGTIIKEPALLKKHGYVYLEDWA